MLTGHTFEDLDKLNHAFPLLVLALAALFMVIFRKVFSVAVIKWGYVISRQEIVVDENLPNFFQAVTLTSADWIIGENRNLR